MAVLRDRRGLRELSDYLWRAEAPNCRSRLICFPHGGGSASAYGSWVSRVPDYVEVNAIALPGRQNRSDEDFATDVNELVEGVVAALTGELERPFVFLGHSCGALLAVEVARRLDTIGAPRPDRIVISGQQAPQVFRDAPRLHELEAWEFRSEVLRLGGFDQALLDKEVLAEVLPPVVADFELWERYEFPLFPRMRSPITCLAGGDDPRAPASDMWGWSELTTERFEVITLPGGHFFLHDDPSAVVELAYKGLF